MNEPQITLVCGPSSPLLLVLHALFGRNPLPINVLSEVSCLSVPDFLWVGLGTCPNQKRKKKKRAWRLSGYCCAICVQNKAIMKSLCHYLIVIFSRSCLWSSSRTGNTLSRLRAAGQFSWAEEKLFLGLGTAVTWEVSRCLLSFLRSCRIQVFCFLGLSDFDQYPLLGPTSQGTWWADEVNTGVGEKWGGRERGLLLAPGVFIPQAT